MTDIKEGDKVEVVKILDDDNHKPPKTIVEIGMVGKVREIWSNPSAEYPYVVYFEQLEGADTFHEEEIALHHRCKKHKASVYSTKQEKWIYPFCHD